MKQQIIPISVINILVFAYKTKQKNTLRLHHTSIRFHINTEKEHVDILCEMNIHFRCHTNTAKNTHVK